MIDPFTLQPIPIGSFVPKQVKFTVTGQYDPLVSGDDVNRISATVKKKIVHSLCRIVAYSSNS